MTGIDVDIGWVTGIDVDIDRAPQTNVNIG